MQSGKAQSAVEYLTTYSWAIITIAITLGALYALGLFNPGAFISNQCIFPANFGCINDFFYSNGIINLNIEQSTPTQINVTAIGCNTSGIASNMTLFQGANQIYIPIGGNSTFATNCYANGSIFMTQPGTLYEGYVIMNYTNLQTGFQHVLIGRVIEKAI
jgi:hypothetical protein